MIDDQSTISETLEAFAGNAGYIAKIMTEFKRKATSHEVSALCHRAAHICEETSRTMRELVKSTSPELRKALDALAPVPAPVVAFSTIKTVAE